MRYPRTLLARQVKMIGSRSATERSSRRVSITAVVSAIAPNGDAPLEQVG